MKLPQIAVSAGRAPQVSAAKSGRNHNRGMRSCRAEGNLHQGREGALSRPTPCVQPKKDQSSPRGHEADAQTLTGLPHPVQRKREPHHDEAGQGQDVHAKENVPGEHRLHPRWGPACGGRHYRFG
jgi:hypothetical protein